MTRAHFFLGVVALLAAGASAASAQVSNLSFGQTQTGTISSAAQTNSYNFSANANDVVNFTMVATSANLSPKITLYNSAGKQLGQAYNTPGYGCTGGSVVELNSFKAPATDTYSVFVGDCGDTNTGNYVIYAERTNNPAGAVGLSVGGQPQTGSIASTAQRSSYTFSATTNDIVDFTVATTSGSLSPVIWVYDSTGTQLSEAYNTPGYGCTGGSVVELNNFKAPATGTYSVFVGACGDTATGNYVIYLQRSNNPAGAVGLLFGGQPQMGSIASTAQRNSYTFGASANDIVDFTVVATSGSISPVIWVYDSTGAQLGQAYNTPGYGCTGGSVVELNNFKAPATGTYNLIIGACGDTSTGNYVIYAQRTNNPVPAVGLSFGGQPQTGSIPSTAQRNNYTFSATANDIVDFTVVATSGSLSPVIWVYDSTGTQLNEAYNTPGYGCTGGSVVELNNFKAPATGTYSVFVGACGDTATGNYVIYLQRTNNPAGAVGLLFGGQPQTGSIGSTAQRNSYTFGASANDIVNFTVVATSGSLSPVIWVYDSTGTQLGQAYNTPGYGCTGGSVVELNNFKAPATGTYNLIIGACGDTNIGNYNLSAQCLGVPGCYTPQPLPLPTPGCQIGLTPTTASVSVSGGAGSLNVGLSTSTCAWTATTNASWVTFPSGSSGTGNGTLNYSVSANTSSGVSRVGSITITTSGAEATYLISESGTGCTYALPQASQAFPAAGGAGTATVEATAGCTWTATSTGATGVTITGGSSGSGNGTVTYTVAPNASSLALSSTLTIAGLPYTITQAGTAATAGCTASVPTVPVVALEGRTETLGNLVLTCTGLSYGLTADVVLTLNTNVSNALVSASATDALLTANGGSPLNGQITAYNTLRWLAVPIAPAAGGTATVQIAGVRADASLLGAAANLQPSAITGLVSLIGQTPVPVTGALETLANASASLAFQKQPASPATGGPQTTVPLVYQETRAGAFTAATGTTPGTRLRMVLTNVPATVNVYAPVYPNEGSSLAQLYSADFNGFGGSPQTGAAMAGATYQQLTVTGGTAVATWVVLSGDGGQAESLTFPLLLTNAAAGDLTTIQVEGSLAPVSVSGFSVSDFSGASAAVGVTYSAALANPLSGVAPYAFSITGGALPAGITPNGTSGLIGGTPTTPGTFNFTVTVTDSSTPAKSAAESFEITVTALPRYRDFSVPVKLVNLRMSTSVQLPAMAPGLAGLAKITPSTSASTSGTVSVGSNVTFISNLLNDTSDPTQTATNVIVRDDLPSGLDLVSCTASAGASCSGSGSQLLVNYGTLGPGQSVTVTVVANVGLVPNGTVMENPVGAVSDEVNADLRAATASSSFIVLNNMPIAVLGQPASGSGSSQSFTFEFTSPSGYQSLGVVNVLINNFLDGRSACYLAYSVSSNVLYLVADSGNAAGPYAGAVALGSPSTIRNSQCAVNLVSAVGSGSTLSLTLNIAFTPAFGGDKIAYVAANQGAESSNWQALGVWQVPASPPGTINVASVTPSRGIGTNGVNHQFNVTVTDTAGAGNIGIVDLLINNFIDGRKACYLAYVASSNTLVLIDDAGDAGGPYAGSMVLNGNSGGVQNSQCSVSAAGSAVAQSANTLTITLNITFTAAFVGNRVMYGGARDVAGGNNTDWQAIGTWTVQ